MSERHYPTISARSQERDSRTAEPRPENGTAPHIEMQTSSRNGGNYLTVRVIDIDGDLDKLLYAKGEHTTEEFANGTVEGTPFTVNDKDTAAFQITEKGTYTFYAVDKKGNGARKTRQIRVGERWAGGVSIKLAIQGCR